MFSTTVNIFELSMVRRGGKRGGLIERRGLNRKEGGLIVRRGYNNKEGGLILLIRFSYFAHFS